MHAIELIYPGPGIIICVDVLKSLIMYNGFSLSSVKPGRLWGRLGQGMMAGFFLSLLYAWL